MFVMYVSEVIIQIIITLNHFIKHLMCIWVKGFMYFTSFIYLNNSTWYLITLYLNTWKLMWRKVNSYLAGKWQSQDLNQNGSVLGSTLEASHCASPSEYKQHRKLWTRHFRGMYGCILSSKLPPQQGRRFTALYPGIQLKLAGLQQVNQLHIFWNGFFFFLRSILFPLLTT